MSSIIDKEDSLIFPILIKPNSKENKIVIDDGILVYVKAAPVKGKANKELIQILSDEFTISRNQISIISGQKSRSKLIKIDDLLPKQRIKIKNYIYQ